MSKIMYTEVIRTTNMAEYKKKEHEFIELEDKTKSMFSTYIRKVTFRSEEADFPSAYSIVMEDMEDIFIEKKRERYERRDKRINSHHPGTGECNIRRRI